MSHPWLPEAHRQRHEAQDRAPRTAPSEHAMRTALRAAYRFGADPSKQPMIEAARRERAKVEA